MESAIGCALVVVLTIIALWIVAAADRWYHDNVLHGGEPEYMDAFDGH